MKKFLITRLVLLTSSSFLCVNALAGGPEATPIGWFPLFPGVTATALSGQLATGFADAMAPIYGAPTAFFYLDPQGQFNNSDQYAASLGAGGRYLYKEKAILGAYVFGDYNHSQLDHSYWFVSPGLEILTGQLDVTGNLYIPAGQQEYANPLNEFGQDIGIFDYVTFAGHTEYDTFFKTSESVGFGGDIDVAYRIPFWHNPKIHLGGYFSNPEDSDSITGGAIRLELPFSPNLNVLVADSYDNVAHNTIRAGVSYSFGSRRTPYSYRGDMAIRMVDPIQRNLIANSSDIHNSQPIEENVINTGNIGVYQTNIAFFLPDASPPGALSVSSGLLGAVQGDGSYENPFIGLSQDDINYANDQGNHNFYLSSGTYGDHTTGMLSMSIFNDNVMGRESYNGRLFVKSAEGTHRPQLYFNAATPGFSSAFTLFGSQNEFSSLYISVGAGAGLVNQSAISQTITDTNNITYLTIDNTDISRFSEGTATGAGFGAIDLQTNAGTVGLIVNITHSNVHNNYKGLDLATSGSTDPTEIIFNISDSNFSNNNGSNTGSTGLTISNATSGLLTLNIDNTNITYNTGGGLTTSAAASTTDGSIAMNIINSNVSHNGRSNAVVQNLTISQLSKGYTTLNAVNSHFDYGIGNVAGGGNGIAATNSGTGLIKITLNNSSTNYNSGSGFNITSTAVASQTGSNIVTLQNGSQVLGNTTAGLTANLGSTGNGSGDTSLIVDNTVGNPTLWNGTVSAINTSAAKTFTATFINKDGTIGVFRSGNIPVGTFRVYCGSDGFCTTI